MKNTIKGIITVNKNNNKINIIGTNNIIIVVNNIISRK